MEVARVKERQRGSCFAAESAKECGWGADEGSDTRLGPSGRRFEPCHSDQKSAEIVWFQRILCVYCGERNSPRRICSSSWVTVSSMAANSFI